MRRYQLIARCLITPIRKGQELVLSQTTIMPTALRYAPARSLAQTISLVCRRILLVSGYMCLVTGALATSVNAPEFTELVNQSDCIVRTVVKSVKSEFVRPDSRKIITKVELEVKEVIAGRPPQPLVLQMLGGKVGDVEMILEGAPQFKVGDEDILFVQGNGQQIYPLTAMMHGRYAIMKEAGTDREYMVRSNKVPLQDTAEVALPMAEGNAAQMQLRMISSAQALTPAQFVERIKAEVKPSNSRLHER